MSLSKIRALPNTKQFVAMHRIEATKSLGQNFLFDESITDQILIHIGDIAGKTILEVGPGPGGLTRSILYANPAKLIAIEFDKNCMPILNAIQEAAEGVLEVVNTDAMTFDENSIPGKLGIISNLPYNMGTQLVLKWLANAEKFEFIVVMLQKEVAERLAAEVSSEYYGRLSIIAQTICDVDLLFDLEPHHFSPPPKVTSTVVRLVPKVLHKPVDLKLLGKVTERAFSMRRKKIRTSLSMYLKDEDFANLSIDSNKRAEDLSVFEYNSIVEYLKIKR